MLKKKVQHIEKEAALRNPHQKIPKLFLSFSVVQGAGENILAPEPTKEVEGAYK